MERHSITKQQLPFKKDIKFSDNAASDAESFKRLEEAHRYSSEGTNCKLVASQVTEPSVSNGRVRAESDAASSFSSQQNQSAVGRDPARNDCSF